MIRSTIVAALVSTLAFACAQSTDSDAASSAASTAAESTTTNGSYVVTSITDTGAPSDATYCLQLPAAVFGQVGDEVDVDWTKSGITVGSPSVDAFGEWNFFVGKADVPYMGGTDHYTGSFTSNDALTFVDVQSPGGPGPYYTVNIARSGDVVTVQTVAGTNHVCTLTKK